MIVFVLWGLWVGRRHLRAVFRKAFRGDAEVDDSEEIMSYRAAVLTLLGGSGFMLWWLCRTGLAPWSAGLTLFVAFVIFVGLTRMVTEGGFFITRAPMNPGNFMVSGFGVHALEGQGRDRPGVHVRVGRGIADVPDGRLRHALKIAEQNIRGSRRMLLWAILVAVLVSAVGSIWMQLSVGYNYGAINMSGFFRGLVHYPFNFTARNLLNAGGPVWEGWVWTAYGGGLMGLLMWLKQRYLWFPIHPLSLPISSMWMTDSIMASVFISWAVKGLILKYGGSPLYQKGKRFS